MGEEAAGRQLMIDDERRRMTEWDDRIQERNRRLDEEWEYRDTKGYPRKGKPAAAPKDKPTNPGGSQE